jgi:hypothetical protein
MITLNVKNFSTAAFAASLAIWGLMPFGQGANAWADDSMPGAKAAATQKSDPSDVFTQDTPDHYVIVKGDTLWGIAGRFLKKPWRWPQIWQMNRDQIKNPHWIYPGQIIVFDKMNGTMHLGDADGSVGANGVTRLEPAVRIESLESAIPAIPQDVIEPFLTQQLIVESDTMRDAPRIVGVAGDRVMLARGDRAYASGIIDPSILAYQIFRPGTALKDPDTGKVIAYQADYLGSARVLKGGDPATLVITSFSEEIELGSRLVAASKPVLINYVPHAPDNPITGRIIATYEGGPKGAGTLATSAGKNMVVTLNRGSDDGLEIGNVLALKALGQTIIDKTNGSPVEIKLPDERTGLMFVFRVFHHISYALLLDVERPVDAGDVFTQP